MLYVGDVHGKTTDLKWRILHDPTFRGKKVFQVGDMGLGFKGVELGPMNREKLLFIRGNHDSPFECRKHHNYAGDYGYIPEEKLFYLGGAWSIDWMYRQPEISWWEDEELSEKELGEALLLYTQSEPLIVATHEAPTEAAKLLLADLAGGYFEAKAECKNTRTSRALQQMLDFWQPKHWVFGHYHVRMDFELQGCQFHCLPELGTLEIVHANL